MKIQGNIIDIPQRTIYFGEIIIDNEKIQAISKVEGTLTAPFMTLSFMALITGNTINA